MPLSAYLVTLMFALAMALANACRRAIMGTATRIERFGSLALVS